jgi:hypothetical protein
MDEERCSEQDRVALVKRDLSSIGTTQGGDKRRVAAGRSDRDRASKIEEVRDASQYGVVTLDPEQHLISLADPLASRALGTVGSRGAAYPRPAVGLHAAGLAGAN